MGAGATGLAMLDDTVTAQKHPAAQVVDAIEPYDVLRIEEPAVPGNIEVFKRLKDAIKVRLATGERDRTPVALTTQAKLYTGCHVARPEISGFSTAGDRRRREVYCGKRQAEIDGAARLYPSRVVARW